METILLWGQAGHSADIAQYEPWIIIHPSAFRYRVRPRIKLSVSRYRHSGESLYRLGKDNNLTPILRSKPSTLLSMTVSVVALSLIFEQRSCILSLTCLSTKPCRVFWECIEWTGDRYLEVYRSLYSFPQRIMISRSKIILGTS